MEDQIKTMIEKAAASKEPDAAMKYAQAALNAANAMCSLKSATHE